jgi:hypothetical protein
LSAEDSDRNSGRKHRAESHRSVSFVRELCESWRNANGPYRYEKATEKREHDEQDFVRDDRAQRKDERHHRQACQQRFSHPKTMRNQPGWDCPRDATYGGSTGDQANNIFLDPSIQQIEVVENKEDVHAKIEKEITGEE